MDPSLEDIQFTVKDKVVREILAEYVLGHPELLREGRVEIPVEVTEGHEWLDLLGAVEVVERLGAGFLLLFDASQNGLNLLQLFTNTTE